MRLIEFHFWWKWMNVKKKPATHTQSFEKSNDSKYLLAIDKSADYKYLRSISGNYTIWRGKNFVGGKCPWGHFLALIFLALGLLKKQDSLWWINYVFIPLEEVWNICYTSGLEEITVYYLANTIWMVLFLSEGLNFLIIIKSKEVNTKCP